LSLNQPAHLEACKGGLIDRFNLAAGLPTKQGGPITAVALPGACRTLIERKCLNISVAM
jgi:hypothetical protein